MTDKPDPPRKPPISEVDDESTAVGDALDEAAPDFPEEKDVVSWSPNDGGTQPGGRQPKDDH